MDSAATNKLHEDIVRLHKSGVPSSHIARKLGCPRRIVNYVIKTKGKVAGDAKAE